ncbi:MAG: DUF4349 domain-containing protein [Oscillospiraceae bacterium]|nr:DUF4349 domain-containing protein [Oscillospiraceae bacterium]MBQ9148211.1 DUF4349 domain-containing protein [Oscillospiraceae bacterium]
MKKRLSVLLALVLAAACLMGCSARSFSNGGAAMDSMVTAPGYMEKEEAIYSESGTAGTGTSAQLPDQKLIKTVTIRAETEDLDGLLNFLNQRIADLGGYIEYQDTYYGSNYSYYGNRSTTLTIRIPAENLNQFVEQVDGSSNVISKLETQDDVTLKYVDTQSRMEALQAEHDRLLELMEQAENMTDLLEIEARLTEVRYQLESITSQLRTLENLVSYATVELTVSEVEVLTPVEEPTVWQRIGTGFSENLKEIGEWFQDLFVWIVTYSPQLVIIAAIVVVIVWLCKRSAKKRKAKKPPYPPYTPPQNPPQA